MAAQHCKEAGSHGVSSSAESYGHCTAPPPQCGSPDLLCPPTAQTTLLVHCHLGAASSCNNAAAAFVSVNPVTIKHYQIMYKGC